MFTITLVSTNAFKAGYYNLLINDFGYSVFKECEESCDPYGVLYGIIDITFRIREERNF
ncbi:hypothetical protein PIROE2DRAFT_11665 [Piromyces sp. E2]|nr:hypothetical protein PIROE2DRAFT_11665 [Piromyces sp. E2]|eukprot:OUM62162.1 hypothetical protein PIROE2DRAFT_11665 [Piromyces sp. E2]